MRILRSIFTILLLTIPFYGVSQQYNFRKYNVEDGLGQSQVYTIHQDELGRLWLGTRGGGISLFDGFEFRSFTNQHGLPSNYVNKIIGDDSGNVWIATNKGLCYYDGSKFHTIKFGAIGQGFVIRDIVIAENKDIYCATQYGIFKINSKKHDDVEKLMKDSFDVASLQVDSDNNVWLGNNDGFFSLKDGNLTSYGEQSVYMNNSVTCVRSDANGVLWIGTYGDGLYCYNGNDFYRIDFHHELYKQTVLDIHFDEHQNAWIATLNGGVIVYDRATKTFSSITENEGLSNNHVRAIAQDANNNFWFGTSGGGLCHYLGKQFTNYNQKSGLAGDYIYSVMRDSKGRLWIGNSQKGVSVLSADGFTNYSQDNAFRNVKVKAIGEDLDGNIWLGTDGKGVYVFKDEEFTEIDELRRAYVKAIRRDASGHIWIATAGSGIIEVTPRGNNYVIEKWTVQDGLLANRITSLHFDKWGRLWYGTESHGIGCLDKNGRNIHKIRTEEGLISDLIRSLCEDEHGRLWVGTAGDGVCSIELYGKDKSNTVSIGKRLTVKNGLKSNNVYLLTSDMDGNLIVGTEKGLDYVYFRTDGSYKHHRHYGRLDGFTGVETCQNSVWKDKNGAIWFGTINGLCEFNPSELVMNNQSPTLSLNDIKLFYESILPSKQVLLKGKQIEVLKLGYSENHISFDFIGINLKRPEGVLYKWRLKGFDERWSPPSKDQSILYSNLNPGKYVFELMAANEDGIWSEEPLAFKFEIETPYWQTTWFIALMIGAFLFLLIAIYLWSTNRIRKKAKAKQEQVELEMDFLELEQKAMRLQMNPHFIFNALNSIQSQIGTGKETEARYYLAKFSRLMRQILDNSRQSEITLEEEISTLENYLLIEQFCNGNRFDYAIKVDEHLETDFINIPPMLIQPFVENAIKHGMKGRTEQSKEGRINIVFKEKKGILECVIEDNGIGREEAAKLKEASKETYHKSTGLSVTTERLQLINPDESLEPFEIIDLYEGGLASGTRVIIRIPIE